MSERPESRHAYDGAPHSNYERGGFDPADLDTDPLVQTRRWLDDATAAGVEEPSAMVLATVDEHGRPATRTVLLRGIDTRGVLFFTNRESRKGRHLAANDACALTLHWQVLQRQVCMTGRAERLDERASAAYFATRPRGSQLGAWTSPQSQVIEDRSVLDRRLAETEARFAGVDDIPMPPFWGGYVMVPATVELWGGRPSRLHDRWRYSRTANGPWATERLAP